MIIIAKNIQGVRKMMHVYLGLKIFYGSFAVAAGGLSAYFFVQIGKNLDKNS